MEELTKLGNEIIKNSVLQFVGSWFILWTMLALTYWAYFEGANDRFERAFRAMSLVLVLGVAWAFMMGKYDFETARIGAWLAQQGSVWETSSARQNMKWMLPVYDLGATLPILALFGNAVRACWTMKKKKFAVAGLLLFLIGLGFFIAAPLVH